MSRADPAKNDSGINSDSLAQAGARLRLQAEEQVSGISFWLPWAPVIALLLAGILAFTADKTQPLARIAWSIAAIVVGAVLLFRCRLTRADGSWRDVQKTLQQKNVDET